MRGVTLGLLVLGGLMLAGDWALESMETRPARVVEDMVRSVHVSSPQSGAEALFRATGCTTHFFLAWTTSGDSFRLRYRRTVESALRFHPEACVVVFSPTLPLDFFQRFWDLGYNVIVERPDIRALLEGTPAEGWLRDVDHHREGKYFYSHVTDIFRFATLHRYGGIYLDTDVIVMRSMEGLENCVGAELAGEQGEAKILNGAIMAFERGSKFLWDCMAEFNATYRADLWGWNGRTGDPRRCQVPAGRRRAAHPAHARLLPHPLDQDKEVLRRGRPGGAARRVDGDAAAHVPDPLLEQGHIGPRARAGELDVQSAQQLLPDVQRDITGRRAAPTPLGREAASASPPPLPPPAGEGDG